MDTADHARPSHGISRDPHRAGEVSHKMYIYDEDVNVARMVLDEAAEHFRQIWDSDMPDEVLTRLFIELLVQRGLGRLRERGPDRELCDLVRDRLR